MCRCALFGAILIGLLGGIELITPPGWGNDVLARKLDRYVADKASDVKVVFVGSSRIYRHVDPPRFDRLSGFSKSLNLGSPDSNFLAHLRVVEFLLKQEERPEVIVLELQRIHAVTNENRHKFGGYYAHDTAKTQLAVGYWSQRGELRQCLEHLGAGLENFFKVGGYLRWGRAAFSRYRPPTVPQSHERGFVPLERDRNEPGVIIRHRELQDDPEILTRRTNQCRAERASGSQEEDSVSERWLAGQLKQLVDKCRRSGVELIWLLPPRNPGLMLLRDELQEIRAGDCIDLGDPDRYPDLYEAQYSFDVGHLNEQGAAKFTEEVARWFRDHRGPEAATKDGKATRSEMKGAQEE